LNHEAHSLCILGDLCDSVAKSLSHVCRASRLAPILAAAVFLAGCTIHPQGEMQARQVAEEAGHPYTRPFEQRTPPTLSVDPTPDDLVRYALLTNAELESKYWEWRAALEQVPQAGTQKAGVEISFEAMITDGATALQDMTLKIGNDAMNSLMLPSKLGTDASIALHEALAAGDRFDKARFELRAKVLVAYYEYALSAELSRLEAENTKLLEVSAKIAESRLSTGIGTQTDYLKAANEVEMSKNESAMRRAKLPEQLAMLNALLNRAPEAVLPVPAALPLLPEMGMGDAELFDRLAENNPELRALAHQIAGKEDALQRAKLEYLPDFNINAGSDLAGVSQSIMGSVVVPYLRYEALDAGIRQAEANLRATEAMQRQTRHDLNARTVADVAMLRDAQRQLTLLDKTLLPRARQIISASQTAYATGQKGGAGGGGGGGGMAGGSGGILDLLDSQRTLVALQRMRAELQVTALKQVADLEEVAGQTVQVHSAQTE
jgi:outer membrane protein TolC